MSYIYVGDVAASLIYASTLPSDGDNEDVVSVDVAFQVIFDTLACISGGQPVYTSTPTFTDQVIFLDFVTFGPDGGIICSGPSVFGKPARFNDDVDFYDLAHFRSTETHDGKATYQTTSEIELKGLFDTQGSSAIVRFNIDSVFEIKAGCDAKLGTVTGSAAVLKVYGDIDVLDSGSITIESDADIIVKSGGTVTFQNNAIVNFANGADISDQADWTLSGRTLAGTQTDDTTTTRTGATVLTGDGGVIRYRFASVDLSAGNASRIGDKYDFIEITGPLTANRSLTLDNPASGSGSKVRVYGNGPHGTPSTFSTFALTIKDGAGSTIYTITGTDAGDPKWVDLLYKGGGAWDVTGGYKESDGSSGPFP